MHTDSSEQRLLVQSKPQVVLESLLRVRHLRQGQVHCDGQERQNLEAPS